MRILVAGFQHETNTFAPSKADYESFAHGGNLHAMVRGADVFALRDVNVPMSGFIRAMESVAVVLVPTIWADAMPSAHVTAAAFERIAGEIVEAAQARSLDGIYLDLHGAMVCEHLDDGEGELLARLRGMVGSTVPIVASLDLHANVTQRMLTNADAMVAYRTYPHVDFAQTGERAAVLLKRLLSQGRFSHRAFRRLPFLIPINAMCTSFEPARDVSEARNTRNGQCSFAVIRSGLPGRRFRGMRRRSLGLW